MTQLASPPTSGLSPLQQTAATATDIWNDSCAVDELTYAIEHGAVGATANPTIVHDVWKKDPARWRARVRELAAERPAATEVDLAWAIVEEMSRAGAKLLEPAFERFGGRQGRLSMQTNPTFWRTPEPMLAQGVHFTSVAPNIIVKFPATRTGIGVMEEATYRGVSVNCTVSFSVAQAVAAAEAVERGLSQARGRRPADRRHGAGHHDHGRPARGLAARAGRARRDHRPPGGAALVGGGRLQARVSDLPERGFRARPLAAAIRHHLHWSSSSAATAS
jgi:transaldolase